MLLLFQVGGHDLVEIRCALLRDGSEIAQDTGIVESDVEAPKVC